MSPLNSRRSPDAITKDLRARRDDLFAAVNGLEEIVNDGVTKLLGTRDRSLAQARRAAPFIGGAIGLSLTIGVVRKVLRKRRH